MAPLRGLRDRLGQARGDRRDLRGLAAVHAVATAADAMFAVSLAGSLFFNVSIDAARPRIVVYLVATMIPFAVLVPLIGPYVDRIRGGHVIVIVAACLGRAGLTLALAGDLQTALLFPEAFGVLVLSKTYSVSRSALVPRLAESDDLVAANAFLSRVSMVGGSVGGAIGLATSAGTSDAGTLYVAAAVYALAAAVAFVAVHPKPARPAPALLAYRELHSRHLLLAVWAVSVLRGALGALTFLLAFSLRTEGAPAYVYGLVIAAGGVGALAATAIGPRLRRRRSEAAMVGSALAIPAVTSLIGALAFATPTAMLASLGMGAGGGLGRQGVDAIIQRTTTDAARGRAFGAFEARFQLAWVVGALLPVLARPEPRIGLLALAVVLAAAFVSHRANQTAEVRFGPMALLRSAGDFLLRPTPTPTVATRLLHTARELDAAGAHRQAALLAAAAIEAATVALPGDDLASPERLARVRASALEAASDTEAQLLAEQTLDLATRLLE